MHTFSRGSSRIFAPLLCGVLLYGCATVPPVNAVLNQTKPAPATVVGPRGPLSPAQTKAILDRLQQQAQGSDLLARHLAIEQALVATPLIAGPATFRAMFAAIKAAKHEVLLEYYIFEDVAIDGQKLGDLLVQKRSEGVQVAIIYDGFGSVDTPSAFFDQLRKAGVALLEFHPLNPLNART